MDFCSLGEDILKIFFAFLGTFFFNECLKLNEGNYLSRVGFCESSIFGMLTCYSSSEIKINFDQIIHEIRNYDAFYNLMSLLHNTYYNALMFL